MGLFVNYINILKKDKDEKTCIETIKAYMQEKGYRSATNKKNTDVEIMLVNDNESKWFTVAQEEFEYDTDLLCNTAFNLAKAYESYALAVSIMDSDFMLMYLTDGKTIMETYYLGIVDDFIEGPIKIDLTFLENLTENKENIPLIKQAFEEEYVFVEDALDPIGNALGFCNNRIMSGIFDDIDNEEGVNTLILGFI